MEARPYHFRDCWETMLEAKSEPTLLPQTCELCEVSLHVAHEGACKPYLRKNPYWQKRGIRKHVVRHKEHPSRSILAVQTPRTLERLR